MCRAGEKGEGEGDRGDQAVDGLEESKAGISVLETEKASMEAELDKIQVYTLVILDKSFDQVVRQVHLFYNEPPPVGTFNANKDVFEG